MCNLTHTHILELASTGNTKMSETLSSPQGNDNTLGIQYCQLLTLAQVEAKGEVFKM